LVDSRIIEIWYSRGGSSLETNKLHYADLWHFGDLIDAPRFQNDTLKLLTGSPDALFSHPVGSDTLEQLVNRGDKKLLKYAVDAFASVCIDDEANTAWAMAIIQKGGLLSDLFTNAIVAR
jgi:hypothetical protein